MDEQGCEVWVAELAHHRPEHDALLDEVELSRADAFMRPDDRSRFVVGVALLKLAVAYRTQRSTRSVRVDRHCDSCGGPHGRPRVLGSDLQVSLSHSGSIVAVALTRAGEVGVDVEHRSTGRALPSPRNVLTASEPIGRPEDLLTYWCRKESVIKATGDGSRVPFGQIVVSAAGEPARLVSYRGNPLTAFMTDLDLGDAYAGAVTVLSPDRVRVDIRSAAPLLQG
jgi:4'-phosphopantetheinyl transferase